MSRTTDDKCTQITITAFFILTLMCWWKWRYTVPPNETFSSSNSSENEVCNLPWYMDPHEEILLEHLNLPLSPQAIVPYCANVNYPHLFKTGTDSLIAIDQPQKVGLNKCVYHSLEITPDGKNLKLSNESVVQLTTPNAIANHHEFIAVVCKNSKNENLTSLMDLFAFVPWKQNVETRIHQLGKFKKTNIKTTGHQLNVVVLILESVSRLSLIRTMPSTYQFLERNAFQMFGHTKISDDPYTNIMAMLTGERVSQLEKVGCSPSHDKNLDGCPFIWKDFSPLGYRTSLAEDGGYFSPFNFLTTGFAIPPTDYYISPFVKIMSKRFVARNGCYGPRLQLEFLLDYMSTTAFTMAKEKVSWNGMRRKYFQILISSMTRNNDTRLLYADQAFRSTLDNLQKAKIWDNTVFILVSDQGLQSSSSNIAYRKPKKGSRPTAENEIKEKLEKRMWLESTMPFLYIMLPPSFLSKHPQAGLNLYNNRKQLTSHYDIYETLQHLKHIAIKGSHKDFITSPSATGHSLFTTFAQNRTCAQVGVLQSTCPCGQLNKTTVDISSAQVVQNNTNLAHQAASTAVLYLNLRLFEYKYCRYFTLQNITEWRIYQVENIVGTDTLIKMTIELEPGRVQFRVVMKYDRQGRFTLVGDFTRVLKNQGMFPWTKTCNDIDNFFVRGICYCWL